MDAIQLNSPEFIALKYRIRDTISMQLNDPYMPVDVEKITPLAGGLFAVRARCHQRFICECLVMDIDGYCTVFFSAGFIREAVIKPELAQYSVNHPWLMGV